jgi:hypothetical protein
VEPADVGNGNDRIRLRLTLGTYLWVAQAVAFCVVGFLLWPSVALAGPAVWALIAAGRIVVRRATSIAFEPTGVEVRLLMRTRRIRKPVAEFSGSRLRGVTVRDLRSGQSYELTTLRGGRRLIAAAEARGYAVLNRPSSVFN